MDCEIRLKFQILVHDEYLDWSIPDKQPVPNSYSKDITTRETYNSGKNEIWSWQPKLVYDENGKPKATIEKIIKPKPPEEYWFNHGKNHKQVDEKNWTKETTVTYWYIDIIDLEHLFNFMKEYNAVIEYDGVLDDKGNSILTARLY